MKNNHRIAKQENQKVVLFIIIMKMEMKLETLNMIIIKD